MILDLIVLVILVISAGIAFFRGFIREVLTIIGVVGGAAAAAFGGPLLSPVIANLLGVNADDPADSGNKLFGVLPKELAADVIAYGSIFILVVLILSLISHMISKSVQAVGLGAIDRSLGVLFGVLRAVLLIGILYLPVYLLTSEADRNEWFAGSKTKFYVEATAETISKALPESDTANLQRDIERKKGSMAKQAREKLEEMDVLKVLKNPDNAGNAENTDEKEQDGSSASSEKTGYEEDQTRAFDEFIEQQFNQ